MTRFRIDRMVFLDNFGHLGNKERNTKNRANRKRKKTLGRWKKHGR